MDTKPLNYTMRQITDQKWSATVLLLSAAGILLVAWNSGGWYSALPLSFLLFATVWHIFVPVRFEINSSGIERTVLGRKWFVSWGDIRAYQFSRSGVLLLPQGERFMLEPMNAFFLPVPAVLMTSVFYQFQNLAGEQHHI